MANLQTDLIQKGIFGVVVVAAVAVVGVVGFAKAATNNSNGYGTFFSNFKNHSLILDLVISSYFSFRSGPNHNVELAEKNRAGCMCSTGTVSSCAK